jgi:hypothetical protein
LKLRFSGIELLIGKRAFSFTVDNGSSLELSFLLLRQMRDNIMIAITKLVNKIVNIPPTSPILRTIAFAPVVGVDEIMVGSIECDNCDGIVVPEVKNEDNIEDEGLLTIVEISVKHVR